MVPLDIAGLVLILDILEHLERVLLDGLDGLEQARLVRRVRQDHLVCLEFLALVEEDLEQALTCANSYSECRTKELIRSLA